LTGTEKCAAFLLTAVSKKALVVRVVPTLEITRRHLYVGWIKRRKEYT